MAKSRHTNMKDPDLLARLWNNLSLAARLMFDRRVSGHAKLIPLLAVLYLLSPVDFLPELAFGPLGGLDDVGILLLALQLFINRAPKDVLKSYRPEASSTAEQPQTTQSAGRSRVQSRSPRDDAQVIEGEYTVRDEER